MLSDLDGAVQSCGCTEGQAPGGLDRLAPVLRARRKALGGPPVVHAGVLFHGQEGGSTPSGSSQPADRAALAATVIAGAGVDAAGVAAGDLASGVEALQQLARTAGVTLVSANLTDARRRHLFRRFRLYEHGELLFGVVGVTSEAARASGGNGVTWQDPVEHVALALRELHERQVDVAILLGDLGLRQTRDLTQKVPGFHFAVVGGVSAERGDVQVSTATCAGDTWLIQMEGQARALGQLQVRVVKGAATRLADASPPGRVEMETLQMRARRLEQAISALARAPEDEERAAAVRLVSRGVLGLAGSIDRRFGAALPTTGHFALLTSSIDMDLPQDPSVLARLAAFDDRLRELALAGAPLYYVGGARCAACHPKADAHWRRTNHATAFTTLRDAGRTADRGCVQCHVTGFDAPGGASLERTGGREDVQCEACHGAGNVHAAAAGERKTGAALFPAPFVRAPGEDRCRVCHDKKHDPDFDFGKLRDQILGPGHARPRGGGR